MFRAGRAVVLGTAVMIGALAVPTLDGARAETATSLQAAKLSADDYIEIQQLYARYNRALDMGDGAGRVATFTADGTFSSALSNHAPDNLETIAKRTVERGNNGTRHWVTNLIITPTAEGADGFCYLLILTGNPHADGILRGRTSFYTDKLVKTANGWRFRIRETWGDAEDKSPFKPTARK